VAPPALAEQGREKVAEIRRRRRADSRRGRAHAAEVRAKASASKPSGMPSGRTGDVAQPLVLAALLLVAQDGVGLVDLL